MEMRGLKNFLRDVVEATTVSPEERIAEELSKIKRVFLQKKQKLYDLRKYMSKLVFIVLMGTEVHFGVHQVIELIASKHLSDKRIGWMGAVVVCGNNPDDIAEIIPEMKRQLTDVKNEDAIAVALNSIASIGGAKIAESVGPTIADLAIATQASKDIKKRALLTLSRLYQSSQQLPAVDRVAPKLSSIIQSAEISVQNGAAILALTLLDKEIQFTSDLFGATLDALNNLIVKKTCSNDYKRYDLPCPFLVAKLFRVLSYKTTWEDSETEKFDKILDQIIIWNKKKFECEASYTFNLLFSEASMVAAQVPLSEAKMKNLIDVLLAYLKTAEFSFDALTKLVQLTPWYVPQLQSAVPLLIKLCQSRIDPIDSKALDLLYVIATRENGANIVDTLIGTIPHSPLKLRPQLCSKLAVLTQSFYPDPQWALDSMSEILKYCDDEITEKMWQWATQLGQNDEEFFKSFSASLLEKVESCEKPAPQLLKLTAWALGRVCPCRPQMAISLLTGRFPLAGSAQPMMIMCLLKLAIRAPEVRAEITEFMVSQSTSMSLEVSQRAQEALAIMSNTQIDSLNLITAPPGYVDTRITKPRSKRTQISDPLASFYEGRRGIIYQDGGLTITATIDVDAPKAKCAFVIKNTSQQPFQTPVIRIDSDDSLIYRFTSEKPVCIDAGGQATITYEIVAMRIFSEFPKLILGDINVIIPLIPARFISNLQLNRETFAQRWAKTADPQLSGSTQLIVPDGDVIEETIHVMKRWLNLTPINVGIPNRIYAAGVFKVFQAQLGILLMFSYDDEELSLTLDVHGTDPTVVPAMVRIGHHAFPQADPFE